MKRALVVTGGIASGKSTVGRMFGELGFTVLDSDVVAREVFETSVVQSWLVGELGECDDMRSAVRNLMGEVSFRKRFDRVIHPLIFDQLLNSDADVLEIPLLIEAGLMSAFGPVVVCDCPVGVARERLIDRIGDVGIVDSMLAAQVSPGTRRIFADEIIRTDLDFDSVRSLVQTVAGRSR